MFHIAGDPLAFVCQNRDPHAFVFLTGFPPDQPALLSKWDRSLYLANAVALEAGGANCEWPGVEC